MATELERQSEVPMRHPWVRWGRYDNGKQWLLMRGEDFEQEPRRAQGNFRQWLVNNNRRGSSRIEGAALIIVIYPEES